MTIRPEIQKILDGIEKEELPESDREAARLYLNGSKSGITKAKLIIKCNKMLETINRLEVEGRTEEAQKLQKRYNESASFIPYVEQPND